jgi:hypothetical protein
VKRKLLPKRKDDDQLIDLKQAQRRSPTVAPLEEGPVADRKRFEAEEKNRIEVSKTLRGMHPLVRQTRDVWKRRRARDYSYGENLPPTLDIRVSNDSRRRALLIMNALLKAIEKRGFPTEIASGRKHPTVVKVQGEDIEIRLYELKKKVGREPTEWERKFSWSNREHYDLEYTGRLKLEITTWHARGGRRSWTDGKIQRLDNRLNNFVVALVATAEKAKTWRKKREELDRKAELERQARLEQQRLQELEEKRAKELKRQVKVWEFRRRARDYVSEVRERGTSSAPPTGPGLDPDEWLEWIDQFIGGEGV